MSLLRKDWTAHDAHRWTVHDLLACIFGVLAFVLVTVGVAGSLLLQTWGFITLGLSIVFTWLTFKVIDPKLRASSRDFEGRQADYLDAVERQNRWES